MSMDMNRTFFFKKETKQPVWRVIDAEGKILGRMATEIADILRGKDKAEFTPHSDAGDYVVVINANKVVLTGNKMEDKEYHTYSGWIGGLKVATAEELIEKNPARIIEHAVHGMLPKNKLSRQLMRKLRVYAGAEHPHQAQQVVAHQPKHA